MKLDDALHVLARVHTDWDEVTGFSVQIGAAPQPWHCRQSDYVEAWEAVRMHLGLNINPSPQPADRAST